MKTFLLLLFTLPGYATSLRLQNETTCPLRALIQSADGSLLEEVLVMPQETFSWEETHKRLAASKSITPLSVIWLCSDGELYGVLEDVSTGALASTKQCVGKKRCSVPNKAAHE